MEDQQIIALYWSRDPQAIDHSSRKYGAYLFTVAHRILSSREDCEECVNDTWLRAWNGMPPQRPDILRMFFAKITRNLAFDVLKSAAAGRSTWRWRSWLSAFPTRRMWRISCWPRR